MVDFIEFTRQRRVQLRKRISALQRELEELEVAERVYRESQSEETDDDFAALLARRRIEASNLPRKPQQGSLSEALEAGWARRGQPKTIKGQVTSLLDEVYPGGLTAQDILERIQIRWNSGLERTSLSPQLSRLKVDNVITNKDIKWFLVVDNENTPPPGIADGVQE